MVGQRQRETGGGDPAHERPLAVILEWREGANIGEAGEAGVLVSAQHGDHVAAISGQSRQERGGHALAVDHEPARPRSGARRLGRS